MPIRYSPRDSIKPVLDAGLGLVGILGYQKRYQAVKYLNYSPARLSKGKRWYILYRFRHPKSGRWNSFKVYGDMNRIKDLGEREEYAKVLMENINRALKEIDPLEVISDDQPKEEKKVWTLGQGLNYFKQKIPDLGIRKKSGQTYQSVLKMLSDNLTLVIHKDISTINKTHLQAALNGNGWSNTTYNNNLRVTRRIFNYLVDADILKENPAARIKRLPATITKHKYFDDKTWEKIKKAADPELLDFILFLYNTGTRPNEARQIKYEDIHGDKLLIRGTISKNRKDAFIPLSEYIQKKYKNGSGLIFGGGVNYFGNKFQQVKKELKLDKDHTLYSIKATRACHLAQDGVSPYRIMELFRHSSLEMTMKYLRDLGLTINRDAVEKGLRF